MRILRTSVALFCATALSGCLTLEPKCARPAAPVAPAFPTGGDAYPAASGPSAAGDGLATSKLAWSDFFTDAKLKSVIALSLRENRDLRTAALNIVKARAQYRVQRSELLPTVNLGANAVTGRSSSSSSSVGGSGATGTGAGTLGGGVVTGGSGATTGFGGSYRSYSVDVGFSSYELDLFGRVRSLSKEALEQYFATEEARRATRVSLIAEVATDYLTLAADLQRMATERETLKAEEATLKITNDRFKYGIVSLLDVQQAQIAVEAARSNIQTYLTAGAQDLNALTLVVGAPVPADLLPAGLGSELSTQAEAPVGLDSAVLLQRPDVLQAEHQLRAYNADIGAARAAFFPTISLTAQGGTSSSYLTNLFGSGTGTYSFSPNISLPIFDYGRNRANLKISKAQRDLAVAAYEKAIQTAFRDVADALAQRGTVDGLIASQERLVAATQGSLTLAQARYDRGADTYLNTLTAQLNLANARQTLISAQLTRASNLVALYRALGGGRGE
ncbi:AdeC/AdeK/OprM family multidrug efflux complex outer membrane factor [soil metagenome]